MYKKDLNIGDKFGEWSVIGFTDKRKHGHQVYKVRCSCGFEAEFMGYYLRTKLSLLCRSCSAKNRINQYGHPTMKHGASMLGNPHRPTYKVWISMRQRCRDENDKNYHNYGGRGITVCQGWDDFEVFLKDMGICPKGLSLDRIDNSMGYYKENCKWVDSKSQNNNKRSNTFFMIDGIRVIRTQIQDKLGWTRDMYRRRAEKHGIEWIIDQYRQSLKNN